MASDGTLKFDTSLDTDGLQSGMGKVASIAQQALGVFTGQMMTRAVDALANLGKSALDSVGQLEQNIGGVETLFGDAADAVIASADRAYQTAGMSANEYMSTVTSFSASLLQSLSGNTEEAAKVADMAIIDMADNANKMGTSLDMIQNAYQGFAKQNYTMLDNLKLGYGGTKTEMERLLADAEKLTGIKYDINNLNDVYKAIHAVQEEMGITGTTAKEAASTLEGSMASAKAAWDNFMNGSGDADQLADAFATAADNIVKNLAEIIPRFAETLPALGGAIIAQIPGLVAAIVPAVLSAGQSVLKQLQDTVLGFDFAGMADKAVQMITSFIEGDGLGSLLDALTTIFTGIVNGISSMLPTLLPALVELIAYTVTTLIGQLPALLDCALQLITGLTQGILDALPVLIAALPEIITSIVEFLLDSIPQIINAGVQLLTSLVNALPEIVAAIVGAIPKIIDGIINALIESIPQIIEAGIQLLVSLVQALPTIIATIVEAIPKIITGIIEAVMGNLDKIIMAGVNLFVALIENLPIIIVEIVKAVPQIITSIVEAFGSLTGKMAEVGGNLVKGLWEGIQRLASWLWDKVSGWIGGIWDGICGFFGIHSPSDEMAWVGEMLVEGLAGAIESNGSEAVKAAESMSDDINDVMHDLTKNMGAALPFDFVANGSVKIDNLLSEAESMKDMKLQAKKMVAKMQTATSAFAGSLNLNASGVASARALATTGTSVYYDQHMEQQNTYNVPVAMPSEVSKAQREALRNIVGGVK